MLPKDWPRIFKTIVRQGLNIALLVIAMSL